MDELVKKKDAINKINNKLADKVIISKNCDGCGYCVDAFECPAIIFRPDKNQAEINESLCVNCGQCLTVCGKGHITTLKKFENNS